MGTERTLTSSGCSRSRHLLCIRYISGPKDSPGWPFDDLFHRCGYCTRLYQHLPAYCCADPDRIWICYCPSGVLCPKRDITTEMET
jgi:hypothetical protein